MTDTPKGHVLAHCVTDDLREAIASVPDGWWWSAGVCSVSCHASVGPDMAYCNKETLNAFDEGFHADPAQPTTLATAIRNAVAQANAAIAAHQEKTKEP